MSNNIDFPGRILRRLSGKYINLYESGRAVEEETADFFYLCAKFERNFECSRLGKPNSCYCSLCVTEVSHLSPWNFNFVVVILSFPISVTVTSMLKWKQ